MATNKAAKVAQRVLSVAWDGKLPVDPAAVAKGLVIKKDGERYRIVVEGVTDFDYSGEALKDKGRNAFVCRYNKNDVPNRRRFTVAHELGHVVLGHANDEKIPRRDTRMTLRRADPIEVAANQFAAELLMPEEDVRIAVRRHSDIYKLSELFGVSSTAMYYRLKNLNILPAEESLEA